MSVSKKKPRSVTKASVSRRPIGITVHAADRMTVRWPNASIMTVTDPRSAHGRSLIRSCLEDYGPRGVDVTPLAYDEGFTLKEYM